MTKDHLTDAILATPPASAGAYILCGMTLSTWALVLTIGYTLILIVIKVPALVHSVRTLFRWAATRKVDNVESD